VSYGERLLQEDTARTETKEQCHSRSDKASGRDLFQMDSQMIMSKHLSNTAVIFKCICTIE
jgi:hypothetical protein